MNNISKNTKDDFEKSVKTIWRQASDATLIMTLGSLGIFLAVFLFLFFLTRDRLSAFYVIPFTLFASFMVMMITQTVIRKILQKKRNSSHA